MTASATPRRPLPQAGSSTQVHPPPFRLPAEHFLAALAWLMAGAVGLIVVAPDLAGGNIFDPRVLAVTHTITLGVITTAIFGALYQLFPVTLGRAVRSVSLAHLTFWLLQSGTLLVVSGFWFTAAPVLGSGWIAVSIATLLFGGNLVSRGLGGQPDRLIGWYVGAGYLALLVALGLASLRVGEALGYWHVDRLAMIASHFHLAALGFATLVAVGVGSRMVPMFLVSQGFPRWPLRWTGPLFGMGLAGFVVGIFSGRSGLAAAGGWVMAAGVGLYVYLATEYFRRRLRRALDPGMAHVAGAYLSLVAAWVVGVRLLIGGSGFAPRLWAGYAALVLLGWLVLLIVGVLYRILPFLTWLHLFGSRMGEGRGPTVADLTRPVWGWASFAFLMIGPALLAFAISFGMPVAARLGALCFAAGVALVLLQAGRVVRLRYAP